MGQPYSEADRASMAKNYQQLKTIFFISFRSQRKQRTQIISLSQPYSEADRAGSPKCSKNYFFFKFICIFAKKVVPLQPKY